MAQLPTLVVAAELHPFQVQSSLKWVQEKQHQRFGPRSARAQIESKWLSCMVTSPEANLRQAAISTYSSSVSSISVTVARLLEAALGSRPRRDFGRFHRTRPHTDDHPPRSRDDS